MSIVADPPNRMLSIDDITIANMPAYPSPSNPDGNTLPIRVKSARSGATPGASLTASNPHRIATATKRMEGNDHRKLLLAVFSESAE